MTHSFPFVASMTPVPAPPPIAAPFAAPPFPAEDTTDDGAGADSDLRGVLTLRGLGHMRARRGLHVIQLPAGPPDVKRNVIVAGPFRRPESSTLVTMPSSPRLPEYVSPVNGDRL